mmetsp:Transcript_64328/g.141779  ORF Transcript_64328/g.141779 Transcript_64328/m.141779 type:complete len:810 (+) Transcript_64328:155-2584(+)
MQSAPQDINAKSETVATAGQVWEVVGGRDEAGVLVRYGRDVSSPAKPGGRLVPGALIREVKREGETLRYEMLRGTGPASGWVSITCNGVDLLVARPDCASAVAAAAEASSRIALPSTLQVKNVRWGRKTSSWKAAAVSSSSASIAAVEGNSSAHSSPKSPDAKAAPIPAPMMFAHGCSSVAVHVGGCRRAGWRSGGRCRLAYRTPARDAWGAAVAKSMATSEEVAENCGALMSPQIIYGPASAVLACDLDLHHSVPHPTQLAGSSETTGVNSDDGDGGRDWDALSSGGASTRSRGCDNDSAVASPSHVTIATTDCSEGVLELGRAPNRDLSMPSAVPGNLRERRRRTSAPPGPGRRRSRSTCGPYRQGGGAVRSVVAVTSEGVGCMDDISNDCAVAAQVDIRVSTGGGGSESIEHSIASICSEEECGQNDESPEQRPRATAGASGEEKLSSDVSSDAWRSYSSSSRAGSGGAMASGAGLTRPPSLERSLKALLNKVSPENTEVICTRLLSLPVTCAADLVLVSNFVTDQALNDPFFSEVYADAIVRLCLESQPVPSASLASSGVAAGPVALLEFADVFFDDFRRRFLGFFGDARLLSEEAGQERDGEEAEQAGDTSVARRRATACVRLMGHLYLRGVIPDVHLQRSLHHLLSVPQNCAEAHGCDWQSPPKEWVECACELLQTVGPGLRLTGAGRFKGAERTPVSFAVGRLNRWKDVCCEKTEGKAGGAQSFVYPPRIRFRMQDILEACASGSWVERGAESRAKKEAPAPPFPRPLPDGALFAEDGPRRPCTKALGTAVREFLGLAAPAG